VKVFEHHHQGPVGRQRLEGLGQLAQRVRRRGPVDAGLQSGALRLAQQSRKLLQPQRRIPPQRRQHVRPPRPAAQLRQDLQQRQVGFGLAMLLHAHATRAPHLAPGGQAGQQQVDHGGLPHPHFATHKDELAAAAGRALAPPLQNVDFALAPHDRARRQRGRGLQAVPHLEAIALLVDRLHIVGRARRIAQGGANLFNTGA
jgi:hypothetical protein